MEDATTNPTVIVLGGVNGAGKTTAARSLLANTLRVMTFVNADIIAQGLSGFDPNAAAIRAGRIMLEQLKELAAQRANFAFETTLAGKSMPPGWIPFALRPIESTFFCFWLNTPDLAVARVANRVNKGGHDVPEATVRQRYERSLHNLFSRYMPVVSGWKVYDNSVGPPPQLIAKGGAGQSSVIYHPEAWSSIRRFASHG